MALTKDGEEKKAKPGAEGEAQPEAAELLLETPARDPEEAALAEQALHHFIAARLNEWHDEVQSAIDELEGWLSAQSTDDQPLFGERHFFDSLGGRFVSQLFGIAGGRGTPIMDAIAREVGDALSFAGHSSFNVDSFLQGMRRGVRDACWYARDACQAILSNQWADLLDLATGGSIEFVPVLFTLGLPSHRFKAAEMSAELTDYASAYRDARAPRKEQVVDKANDAPVREERLSEVKEDARAVDMQELDPSRRAQAQTI